MPCAVCARSHLHDHVGVLPDFGRPHDLGARGLVIGIGEMRGLARALLHEDAEARLDQLGHRLRGDRVATARCELEGSRAGASRPAGPLTSGVAATRFSRGNVSFGTPTVSSE